MNEFYNLEGNQYPENQPRFNDDDEILSEILWECTTHIPKHIVEGRKGRADAENQYGCLEWKRSIENSVTQ